MSHAGWGPAWRTSSNWALLLRDVPEAPYVKPHLIYPLLKSGYDPPGKWSQNVSNYKEFQATSSNISGLWLCPSYILLKCPFSTPPPHPWSGPFWASKEGGVPHFYFVPFQCQIGTHKIDDLVAYNLKHQLNYPTFIFDVFESGKCHFSEWVESHLEEVCRSRICMHRKSPQGTWSHFVAGLRKLLGFPLISWHFRPCYQEDRCTPLFKSG